jgi:hypothetical protein
LSTHSACAGSRRWRLKTRLQLLVDLARGAPHRPEHQWNQRASRQLGVDRQPGRLAGLAQVQQQADHVVADGRDRQAFDRALQAQLQFLALGEFFQQLPVLPFGGNVDPGAQQRTGPVDALGQRSQALRRGRHRGHGRRQAPLHELADGLGARNRLLAQLGNALTHQRVVGPRGREAVGMLGRDPLDAGGQRHQGLQQVLVAGGLALQLGGDVGQRRSLSARKGPSSLTTGRPRRAISR